MTKHIHGGDIYSHKGCLDFSANCNPLGTPKSVKDAITDSLSHIGDYPQVGYEPLKKAIARYEDTDPSQVICGNGAAELIYSFCQAARPEKALIPVPAFAEYEQALRTVDCEVVYYPLKKENGFFLDEEILPHIGKDTDVLFLCNPNNPTGLLTERTLLLKILEQCRNTDTLLVVDECFLDFVKEPEKYTLKEYLKQYPNLFLLKAFTKRYAMAGVRLGYGLSGNAAFLEKMSGTVQPWNLSVMAQAAGIAALKEEAYVAEGRQLVFSQAEILKQEFKNLGFLVYPSSANYIFFEGPRDLYERSLQKGILIRDCSNYAELRKGFWRIAVKKPSENQKLLTAFREIMDEIKRGKEDK